MRGSARWDDARAFLLLHVLLPLPLHNFADLQPPTSTQHPTTSHRIFGTPPTNFFATSEMRADCLPHARVSVLVDGATLPEYSTESGDGMGATTFVEAVPGATFAIELWLEAQFAQRNPNDSLNFVAYLDGEYVRSILVRIDHLPFNRIMDGAREQTAGECIFRAFGFAQHETSMLSFKGLPSKR